MKDYSIAPSLRLLGMFISLLFFIAALAPAVAHAAWPTETQWIGVYKNSSPLTDPNGDTNGSRNIVSDADHWAAMVFYDGTYFYCRLRLDDDPSGQGGQGYLQPYGWGVEFDTDQDATDFEWLTLLDGISKTEAIRLFENTVQGTLGDPGDQLEVEYTSVLLLGNYQVYPADTSFNGDQDYWLEWRFPYDTLKSALGVEDNTPIRLFFGSSSSANTLSENGADLCGGSGNVTLEQGLSDYIVLGSGKRASEGSVMFVGSASSPFGNMTSAGTGETLYVKVVDDDPNYDNASLQSVTVTLSVPSGDSETIALTETGVDTGTFTGSITNTVLAATPYFTSGNGVLETLPQEVVTATYTDAATPNTDPSLPPYLDVPRTDTLTLSPPSVSVAKSVDPASVMSGGTVMYTVTVTNSGAGAAVVTSVEDTLPAGFSYVPGTTTGFTTDEPTVSGRSLTWTGTWALPRKTGSNDGEITLWFQVIATGAAGDYYNNAAAGGLNFTSVSTGDTAPVTILPGPVITLDKTVDQSSAVPGTVLTFTVYYHNTGGANANNMVIIDTVPPNMTYVPGSLRMGDASSTYSTATRKTDDPGDDEAEFNGTSVIFTFGSPVAPGEEGKVYLQLQIDS